MPNQVYYSPADICEMFGIAKSTLFRWESEGWLPRVGRDLNGQRQYTLEHIKTISERQRQQLGRQLAQVAEVEDKRRLEEISETLSLLKFLKGNEDSVIGLSELAEYEHPSPQTIRQLQLTALKQYEPGDVLFTKIAEVVYELSCKLSGGEPLYQGS